MIDVVGMGNALVDVIAHTSAGFPVDHGFARGTATMVDEARADQLYAALGPATEMSGGSAANTMAGLASFGSRAAYFGRVRDDQLGKVFVHDLRSLGVRYDVPPAATGAATGRCLVMVTPDAQRTMCTYLGASAQLPSTDVDPSVIEDAAILYLEGYLWDEPDAKQAMRDAATVAHESGCKVALTLSDPFCVARHRDEFRALVEHEIDVLFANEIEVCSLYEVNDFGEALEMVRHRCEIAALTRSEQGSTILRGNERVDVAAAPVGHVVDTTGAGDQYAAGFLHGLTHGADLAECGRLGSLAAAEVISHVGARPETTLADLARS